MESQFKEWEEAQHLVDSLKDSRDYLIREYDYDVSSLSIQVKVLEATQSDNPEVAVLKHSLTFFEQDNQLLSLEFSKISKEFDDALWGSETDYVHYGIAKVLSHVECDTKLSNREIQALTHVVCFLNTYGLVVCEETEMKRQPAAFQEMWRLYWREGKPTEFQGVRYLRYDDPFGWNA